MGTTVKRLKGLKSTAPLYQNPLCVCVSLSFSLILYVEFTVKTILAINTHERTINGITIFVQIRLKQARPVDFTPFYELDATFSAL